MSDRFPAEEPRVVGPISPPARDGDSSARGTSRTPRTASFTELRGLDHAVQIHQPLAAWRDAAFAGPGPRFHVTRVLGKGSQGVVFEIEDRDCHRRIALKTMWNQGSEEELASRFVHEAQITAQLEHPGIVPVHDLDVLPDGTVFYTMKRIEGDTLDVRLAALADLPPSSTQRARAALGLLQAFLTVCDTVAFAHSRGVVHRDIKPRNIMLGPFGEVLMLDWGLAKVLADGPDRHERTVASVRSHPASGTDILRTLVGAAVGTPAYMSPEQARGEPATPASDVYSLGVSLYHILAGCSPYQRGDVRETLRQCADGRWDPLDSRPAARHLPRRLVAVVHKAMALDPANRYPGADRLAEDLRRFLADEAVAAHREGLVEATLRRARRHRRPLIAAAAVAACALIAGGWWQWQQASERAALAAQLRHSAHQLEGQGRFADARHQWERILELAPGDPEAGDARLRTATAEQHEEADRLARSRAVEATVWRARAEQAAAPGDEGGLLAAADCYLRALGLQPDDPGTDRAYRGVVARIAAIAEQRRHEEARLRAEAERRTAAADLQRRADEAQREGRLDAAVGALESALALDPSPERGRILGALIARRQEAERERADAERRRDADAALGALASALAGGHGEEARGHLERARGFAPAHPDLAAAGMRVEARLRDERAAAADADLAEAAAARRRADALDVALRNDLESAIALRSELGERPTTALRSRLRAAEQVAEVRAGAHATARAEEVAALHRAAARAPWHTPVRAALCQHFIARLLEAERDGRGDEAAAAEAQALVWDDGAAARLLAGEACVRVPGNGVRAILRRLTVAPDRTLTPTDDRVIVEPGSDATVAHGRWLAEGAAGTRALRIERGASIDLAHGPAPAIPAGTAWIPAGIVFDADRRPLRTVPGFAIGRTEITCGEYLDFLNDPGIRSRIDDAQRGGRLILAPRTSPTADDPLWRRDVPIFGLDFGPFVLERNGTPIDAATPVSGISWSDACVYAAWRKQRDGLPWRLPEADEWMLAAQGGDGRPYPWGDLPDAGLCASARTTTHKAWDGPAAGSFPADRSVQGVLDLAGSLSEFVATPAPDGSLRLHLGGNRADATGERLGCFTRREADGERFVHPAVGFRLACTPP